MYNSRCIWFFDVLIIKCLKKYCFKNPAHFAYDTAQIWKALGYPHIIIISYFIIWSK